MKNRGIAFILSILFLSGCSMFEYHPYDGHVSGETDINAKNIKRIEENCAGKTTIRFAVVSDTQRWYDETDDFVKAINKRNDIDFVLHAGDIADFGVTKEYMWMRDILNGLKVPYVVVLGNHDCLANGKEIFEKIFGTPNFSFYAGDTKFVCLNTNALEFDYSHPIPDFEFLEKQLEEKREEHKKTIVAMHVRPFSDAFNNNVAKVFQQEIKKFPELQFCLNGHDHQITKDDLFEDGIIYYGCPNVGKNKHLIFTLKPDNKYDYEVVEF